MQTFTEEQMTSFGNYLLKNYNERLNNSVETFRQSDSDDVILFSETSKMANTVSQADFENWKEEER